MHKTTISPTPTDDAYLTALAHAYGTQRRSAIAQNDRAARASAITHGVPEGIGPAANPMLAPPIYAVEVPPELSREQLAAAAYSEGLRIMLDRALRGHYVATPHGIGCAHVDPVGDPVG